MKADSFKILEEYSVDFQFVYADTFYIMLVQINDKYALEVNNRTHFIGRVFGQSKQEIDLLLDEVVRKTNSMFDVYTAWDALELAFKYGKSFLEFAFVYLTQFRKYDVMQLDLLKRKYQLIISHCSAQCILDETISEVNLHFKRSSVPVGFFRKISNEEDSKYIVRLNSDFIK